MSTAKLRISLTVVIAAILIRWGIRPERIQPGCPQQNGRHERFHETLKAETASPPKGNLSRQQACFADFQAEYNHLRPHEALGNWACKQVYISVLLENQDVALRPLDDGLHEVFFGSLLLGWFDEPSATFTPHRAPPRSQKRVTAA